MNVGELVDKRLSPAFGEEVDLHGRRVRIGRTAPVEHHLHIVRLQAAAAEVLVFTAGKQHGEHPELHEYDLLFCPLCARSGRYLHGAGSA